MKARMFLVLCLLLAGTMILASPTLAGGWAVITLDELPREIIAEQPFKIGFTVRQHGITHLDGLTPTISAHQPDSNLIEGAKAQGAAGHYIATLTFPQGGEWKWSIRAFMGSQSMPPLSVAESDIDSQSRNHASIPANLPLVAGGVGLVGLATGLLVAFRRNARWAIALILVGLILSAGSIVSAAEQSSIESDAKVLSVDTPISQVEEGRQLFIAKGCMVCHSNADTNHIREFGVDIGPDLSNFSASPEYLRLWLAAPQSVKPGTGMPDLDLSEVEIESLIAYLNEK